MVKTQKIHYFQLLINLLFIETKRKINILIPVSYHSHSFFSAAILYLDLYSYRKHIIVTTTCDKKFSHM